MKSWSIDINCDVGEGVTNEEELFPFISSCNIACGGHKGNETSMQKTIQLAQQHQVKIGVHPSYPDSVNFGRVSMNISSKDLIESIKSQLRGFTSILKRNKGVLHHIKPHGALYNDVCKDKNLAETFLLAIENYKTSYLLYVPHDSVIEKMAIAQGWNIKAEVFGDRRYTNNLSLLPRQFPEALITSPEEVLQQIINMVRFKKVKTFQEEEIAIKAETICIHGDTPNALDILMYLSDELPQLNIRIDK